jgi:predicted phosphoribosyltransferase
MFASRQDAGRKLGHYLRTKGVDVDVVVGLPRGGVVVAAEVARVLQRPLDVLVVRKIGHPLHREFAVGALAENGVTLLSDTALAAYPVVRAQLENVIREETARLRQNEAKFHHGSRHPLSGKRVLLVDDGLATGATTEAAVLSAEKQGAREVIIASPVASLNAVERLSRVADDAVVLLVDPDFDAVGRYYSSFLQTSDDEVLALLEAQYEGSVKRDA